MSNVTGDLDEKTQQFLNDLRQRIDSPSYTTARTVVCLLKDAISFNDNWTSASDLMDIIRKDGLKLMSAQPSEAVVGNMVKRVLKVIRDAYEELKFGKDVGDTEREIHEYNDSFPNLKDKIIDSITDLLEELDQSVHSIACESLNHIHSNEVVMTIGRSNTVEQFLKAAAKKRKFHVIVAECAPAYHGHELAVNLSKNGIETTVITDSSVFAVMSRVNKVIIGTNTVLANGGLKAVSGSYSLALAAKHYSVPLIVCTALYKLSPEYLCSIDQNGFNRFLSPQSVVGCIEDSCVAKSLICNPAFDYVPPELVTLFIFNIGGNAPSYIYRLLSEMYHPDDYDLELDYRTTNR